MKTILIALDQWDATAFGSDHWATASWFFGPRGKFLNAIATIAVINPVKEIGEKYVETITETAEELIGRRLDDPDEENPPPADLSEDDRESVIAYLLDCHKAIRPYLPDSGSLALHSFVTSPDYDDLYLIIKHHDDKEYPDQTVPGSGIRAITTSG